MIYIFHAPGFNPEAGLVERAGGGRLVAWGLESAGGGGIEELLSGVLFKEFVDTSGGLEGDEIVVDSFIFFNNNVNQRWTDSSVMRFIRALSFNASGRQAFKASRALKKGDEKYYFHYKNIL